MVTSKYQWFTR